jgi:soluble lytic murein transglycosylase-like protein
MAMIGYKTMLGYVNAAAKSTGVPAVEILAISAIESSNRKKDIGKLRWNTRAVSDAYAQGLMQLIPETVGDMEKAIGTPPGGSDPYNPAWNVLAGATFLKRLNKKYKNKTRAAAAYFSGPGRVDRWLRQGKGYGPKTKKYVKLFAEWETFFKGVAKEGKSKTPAGYTTLTGTRKEKKSSGGGAGS